MVGIKSYDAYIPWHHMDCQAFKCSCLTKAEVTTTKLTNKVLVSK